MCRTVQLSDIQLMLLSHASQNDAGALLPIPEPLQSDEDRAHKALKSLLRRKLIEEREVAEARSKEGDIAMALFITDAGHAAIGVDEHGAASNDSPGSKVSAAKQPSADQSVVDHSSKSTKVSGSLSTRPGSKIATVASLLQRKRGATLEEMTDATGWQPHSTRAALTGLRKKGQAIEKSKRDDETCYRIVGSA